MDIYKHLQCFDRLEHKNKVSKSVEALSLVNIGIKCNFLKCLKELKFFCYIAADSHTSFMSWTRHLVVSVDYDSITNSFFVHFLTAYFVVQ